MLLVGIVAAGAVLGRSVLSGSSGGGWSHQVGEAWEAERTLARGFESGIPNLILVVDPVFADLDDADVAAAVATMTDDLAAHPGITQIDSYWSLGGLDSYASDDGSLGLVTARIGGPEVNLAGRVDGVLRAVEFDDTTIDVTVGGLAVVQRDAREAALASMMPLGVAAVVSIGLVLLFLRNLALAGLIAATSIIAASMTMIALWALGRLVDFTTLSVLLAIAVTWGLATAGGFVFGHRFVAERRAGADRAAAVVATMGSAGRTMTLAVALATAVLLSLAVMPTVLVRTIAYATAAGALAAGVAGIVVLGLLLSLFGAGLTTGSGLGAGGVRPGISTWVVRVATGRPVLTATVSLVVLGAASWLAVAGLRTGETAAESLPPSVPSRQVADVVANQFSVNEIGGAFVIGPNVDFTGSERLVRRYTRSVSSIEGVARTDSELRSFAGGTGIEVPAEVTERLLSDRATLVWVPLSVDAGSPVARAAIEEIEGIAAPFRADIGGATARATATVEAVDSRTPFVVVIAAAAILLIAAWLLRARQAALRLAETAVLAAAGAVLVVRLGFVGGWLASPLGSTPVGTLDAVAAPTAWAMGLALVAAWLALAWGSAREAHDVTDGDVAAPLRALAATRSTHLAAAVLLWLPLLALVATQWRTQQIIAASIVGAGVLAVTVGRFVTAPALLATAPRNIWPRQGDGTVDPVYPRTAAAAWLVGAEEAPPPRPDAGDIGGVGAFPEPPWQDVATDADLDTWERAGWGATVGVVDPAVPLGGAEVLTGDPEEAAEAPATARRRRSRWRRSAAAMPAEHEDESEATEASEMEAGPDLVAEADMVTDADFLTEADLVTAADLVTEQAPAAHPDGPAEKAMPEPAPILGPGAVAETEPEPVVAMLAHEAEADREPNEVVAAEADAVEPEAVEPERAPVAAAVTDDPVVVAGVEPSAPSPEPTGDDQAEAEPADAELAAVDVVSLTESVIASIDTGVPFTTEISSGLVANPSNNLSRVMEAILRDASGRGGEEVLVYGHAAGGRYRWMVVDSGPRADHDPERARTLAEAQRFIRRVGGVVECRPEGEFTVFVVEIPMAS